MGWPTIGAAGVAIAAMLVGALIFANQFNTDCRAHGGAHVTFPYKSWPECWDAEGRRVFW